MLKPITAYNLAEGSNWLARTFRTPEAELDAVFAKKESGSLVREDFDLIHQNGGPSKAVVIFRTKE
jgi:hypothetical protein